MHIIQLVLDQIFFFKHISVGTNYVNHYAKYQKETIRLILEVLYNTSASHVCYVTRHFGEVKSEVAEYVSVPLLARAFSDC